MCEVSNGIQWSSIRFKQVGTYVLLYFRCLVCFFQVDQSHLLWSVRLRRSVYLCCRTQEEKGEDQTKPPRDTLFRYKHYMNKTEWNWIEPKRRLCELVWQRKIQKVRCDENWQPAIETPAEYEEVQEKQLQSEHLKYISLCHILFFSASFLHSDNKY